jgi:hypothetical protein
VTDDTTPATSEAATEKPADAAPDAAPGAEAVTPAPLQGPPPPWPLVSHPGDELAARRQRERLERGESPTPYAEGVPTEQYRSYINQLLGVAGSEPITQLPGVNTDE